MLEVCVAIIQNKDEILICQRAKEDFFSNIWEFPGGKKENYETSEECIKREIFEELEIEIIIDRLFAELVHEVRGRELLFKFFLASTNNFDLKLHVHQDYKWIKANQLSDYTFMEADIVLFDKLKSLP